jgi:tripeptide aminopeptidase
LRRYSKLYGKHQLDGIWREKLLNRFITYIKIYSTSDAESETTPSTERQWDIANYLYKELQDLGLEDVSIDEKGYVFGFIPSNKEEKFRRLDLLPITILHRISMARM